MIDEETGVEPIAQDGEPSDELAMARAKRRRSSEVGSIAERAQAQEEAPEEMFPLGTLDGDPRVTLRTLIRSGLPVETTASLRSAEVPLLGGLVAPDVEGQVIVSFKADKFEVVPRRDQDRVVGWKIRQVLRPTYVRSVSGSEGLAQAI